MPNQSSKKNSKGRKDLNQLAASIVDAATSDSLPEEPSKNPAAVALGRLGGLKGGAARAASLSASQRKLIASKAAAARWGAKPRPANKLDVGKTAMVQTELPLIPHKVEGKLIQQRASDGFINATAMCNAANKQIGHYFQLKFTKEFLHELCLDTHLLPSDLVQIIKGGNPDYQGTWVHPQVAIHLAQWLSPKFAVQVAKWVYEWLSGGVTPGQKSTMPVHLQRYVANLSEIPRTHFSILNELTFALIAPLESSGYTLPETLVPDISQGRMFSDWLRKEKGIEPKSFPTYKHRYMDGRVVDARLYPNELLAEFRKHFHEVWLPQRAEKYFAQRDQTALAYLPKLLPAPHATN